MSTRLRCTLAARSSTLRSAVAAAALIVTAAALGASPGPHDTPRLADGHPDLNGTWDNGSGIDFLHPQRLSGGSVCVAGCDPPPAPAATRTVARARPAPNFPRYRPQYLAKVKYLSEHQQQADGVLHCRSPGVPRIGPPDKIVERPGEIVFLYDDVSGSFWRIIPTDGRPHRTDIEDSTLGDGVGHWEGDTLVVDDTHFSDDTWITDNGAFHTNKMHVIERLHRAGDTLEWQATVEDPTVLLEPWQTHVRQAKLTHDELVEPTRCVDQDIAHEVDDTHHDNPR